MTRVALIIIACAGSALVPAAAGAARAGTRPHSPVTIYVDSRRGDDNGPGTSAGAPVRSLRRALAIAGADRILLKRGSTFPAPISIRRGGSSRRPRVLGAYGRGPLPYLGGGDGVACLTVDAAWVTVSSIRVSGCRVNGMLLLARHDVVQDAVASGNGVGIAVRDGGGGCVIRDDLLRDNDRMVVNRAGDTHSYGAIGIAVNGADGCSVSSNVITGSYGPSAEFGEDGSAVELNGASHTMIDRNHAEDDLAFSELGGAGTIENTFAFNAVSDSIPDAAFLTVHGNGEFGGAEGTRAINNTVDMTGTRDTALYCEGCSPRVLDAVNNILTAPRVVGFPGPWGDSHNMIDGDPQFVAPAAGDLHVPLTSPAIAAGIPEPYSRDIDGGAVDQPPDLGAYQDGTVRLALVAAARRHTLRPCPPWEVSIPLTLLQPRPARFGEPVPAPATRAARTPFVGCIDLHAATES